MVISQEWMRMLQMQATLGGGADGFRAHDRARGLLLSMLDAEQRRSFMAREQFELRGSLGTRYRLRLGHTNNISWLDARGNLGGVLCAHPRLYPGSDGGGYDWGVSPLPDEDVVLGQFLGLVTDEREFLSHAVKDWGNWPPPVKLPWVATVLSFGKALCAEFRH
jgi:hypothetical protein